MVALALGLGLGLGLQSESQNEGQNESQDDHPFETNCTYFKTNNKNKNGTKIENKQSKWLNQDCPSNVLQCPEG